MSVYTKSFLVVLVISLIGRVVLSITAYSGDLNNHIGWAESILQSGTFGAYDRQYPGIMQPTYPPLALYAFVTSTWSYHVISDISHIANNSFPAFPSRFIWFWQRQQILPAFNKVPAILSDIGIGVLIYVFLRRNFPSRPLISLIGATAYLFNPAVWYTSSIWGQIETLPLFFILLSYWCILQKKIIPSHLAFAAALLSKQSSIIFLPVFLLVSWRLAGPVRTVVGLLFQLLIAYLVYLPFFSSPSLLWPVSVYLNRIQIGSGSNYISDHAFNLWALVTRLQKIPDTSVVFLGLSAGLVGLAAFILSYCLALLVLWKKKLTFPALVTLNALIPALAFLVLTKMHERYFAPVLPFLALAAAYYPWLWPVYVLVSAAHLANLYHLWWFPPLPPVIAWLMAWPNIMILIMVFTAGTLIMAFAYASAQLSQK
ncbi:hypothetical protein A3H89_01200 [Candidatus Amesbacteria bacterium RIFCSPLOWO2_02_FULL_48_11]|uniref:Glycosyltransferase RgtA/B/C/D-like domain-containing protein n=2 Tax=Candidatus Amesiibacteriota TaxID=1752730 RepID=A0A1F4Z9F0_9BACT|nr:MAG: hypothetical protein UY22_C0007G0015 [Candidatus Amesbacteria bacterium GW2011_GWC1_48_10]OGC89061.1 MAG: hypothetical protein A2V48_01785 [Candidatus Amesbacteria bacterium RBG_19FT_COMBO_48_16]OGC97289.1 MAG: hypothetical protein A2W16_01015 [Candidatus Amesbacteria bacterium RBG_16_48_31]OGC99855.1 MAG: hypothetical protein A2702_02395 [Candidatus Amesbacteria bacterium RIFCSPHIGHO2_01_FULL_48_75]OGD02691.1 MAG: hypothetical protein A3E17_02530 [Candidatus Amesbacteria bacterium RIFC